MYNQLIENISSRYKIQTQDIELCKKLFESLLVDKNKIVEEANKVPKYLYYILTGYMRLFYYNKKEKRLQHI